MFNICDHLLKCWCIDDLHALTVISRYLGVAAMLINERNDGSDVLLFDDIQRFRAVDEHTVQHVQHTLTYSATRPAHLNKQCKTSSTP